MSAVRSQLVDAGGAGRLALVLLTLLVAFAPARAAEEGLTAKQRLELVEKLSRIRQAAGLNAVRQHPALRRAAEAHGQYLLHHGGIGHTQQAGAKHFLGAAPADRTAAAGYASRLVRELVARTGGGADANVIEVLMSSVYHRLQLLHLQVDEAGIGTGGSDRQWVYVLDLGHSRWRKFCDEEAGQLKQELAFQQDEQKLLYAQCADESMYLPAGRVESMRQRLLRSQPAAVLWPPHDYEDFPVLMSLEKPRPLIARPRPGNPLTLQFNLSRGIPQIKEWQLLERRSADDRLRQIEATLLTRHNDPNQLLREGEYALIALDSLRQETTYESLVVYELNGNTHRLRWNFQTRSLPWPEFDLAATDTVWSLSGQSWVVTGKKSKRHSLRKGLKLRGDGRIQFRISNPLSNVYVSSFTGPECATAQLEYRSLSRTVRIRPPDAQDPEGFCAKLAEALPGQLIHGVNDRVEASSGTVTLVSLVPESENDQLGKVRWFSPKSCKVEAEYQSKLTLALRIRCPSDRRVRFSFSKGRHFTVTMR